MTSCIEPPVYSYNKNKVLGIQPLPVYMGVTNKSKCINHTPHELNWQASIRFKNCYANNFYISIMFITQCRLCVLSCYDYVAVHVTTFMLPPILYYHNAGLLE